MRPRSRVDKRIAEEQLHPKIGIVVEEFVHLSSTCAAEWASRIVADIDID